MDDKPKCKLSGTDGNIFSLSSKAVQALKKAGLTDKANELQHKIFYTHSYHEALALIKEYVEVN
jgi:hypothetical protein